MELANRIRLPLPWHYWPVTLAGLAWNAWGGWLFWLTASRDPATMAARSPAFINWIDSLAYGVTLAWLVGVAFSLAGSIGMLMRSRWAAGAFAISLAGALASYGYQFTHLAPGLDGVAGMVAVALLVTALVLGQLVYAAKARRAGLLA